MMNTKRSTYYLIESRTWVSSLWGSVLAYRVTFDRYLEMKREMLIERFPKSVPQYVRDQAHAYETAFYHIHTSKMRYAHEYDGRAYFCWDALPEAGKQLFRKKKGRSAHVWPGPECVNGAPIESLRPWGEWSL